MAEAIVTDAKDVNKEQVTNEQINESTEDNVSLDAADSSSKKKGPVEKRQEALDKLHETYYGDLLNKDAITHPKEHAEYNSSIGEGEEETELPVEQAAQKTVQHEAPFYRNDKGEWVTKVKVNGIEREESIDKILATAQKHESADKRLQEAAQRQKELNELAHEIQLREARSKQNQTLLSKQDVKPTKDYAKEVKDALERMYDGDVDVAAEKLTALLAERNYQTVAPTIDEQALIERAANEALTRTERLQKQREFEYSVNNGKEWLAQTYPNIMKDQELYNFVDFKTAQLFELNPTLSPEQIIKQAANDVAKMTGLTASSREAEKQNIKPEIKKQSNLGYKPPRKKEVDNSPLAVINQMKADRARIRNSPS